MMSTKTEMLQYLHDTLVQLDNEREVDAYTAKVEELYSKFRDIPLTGYYADFRDNILQGWRKNFDMFGNILKTNSELSRQYPNNKSYRKRTLNSRMVKSVSILFGDCIEKSTLPDAPVPQEAEMAQVN